MKNIYPETPRPEIPRLALLPDDATVAIGCSRGFLSKHSYPNGPIPCIKIGGRIFYPVHLLKEYMTEEAKRQKAEHEQGAGGGPDA